ncbi:hypothetical protein QTL95_15165 [Rhizobium sp. S152]|uniref:hypothetical protein n=1 Tax=Rhizobium sp. S152 TaxID=3055038 RepID=UPI0025AA2630|nr:hypothetical protein [Rhizobium sp. S152]MDM9627246.1 hypothetical protein [Rhizobium sp. S152]
MAKILQIIGVLIVLAVLIALLFLVAIGSSASVLFVALPWAIPSIVCGILIAAFGSMLEQLVAIRLTAEKQTAILEEIAHPQPRMGAVSRSDRG